MPAHRIPLAERFWPKVDKNGPVPAHRPELGKCWLWTAAGGAEYGRIRRDGHGPFVVAHRVAYELLVGPVPEGLLVLHRCDRRPCVNPAHLFVGSHADNTLDMMEKQRHWVPRGTAHPCAKLSAAQVGDARMRWQKGTTQASLAREFSVSASVMSELVRGLTYADCP